MTFEQPIKTFLEYIKPGCKVLDLGAGEGIFSRIFADLGANVTAVDPITPVGFGSSIISIQSSVEDFCVAENTEFFDLIFARNILQFLDKAWVFEVLFPWVEDHTLNKAVVAIETFYQNPEPPFDRPMKSLYNLSELQSHFFLWQEVFSQQTSFVGLDLNQKTHRFFVSRILIQKQARK